MSDPGKLGVGSLGHNNESLGQADELVEVAHVGYLVLESFKDLDVS